MCSPLKACRAVAIITPTTDGRTCKRHDVDLLLMLLSYYLLPRAGASCQRWHLTRLRERLAVMSRCLHALS